MDVKIKIQYFIASLTVIISFVIAFISFFTPPTGVIDSSVLWFFAQCLMFAASIFGVGALLSEFYKHVRK